MRPLAFLCLLLLPSLAPAGSRWGGLDALAVSPDGKVVATGGQSRVVFLLDGTDLAVRNRVWHGARITALAFNKDGSRLAVADDSDSVLILEVATGKPLVRVAGVRGLVATTGADLAVVRSLAATKGTLLRVLSLTDGSERGRVELTQSVSAYVLDAEGKRVTVLTMSREGDERRTPLSETPRDLRGLARREYQQKHDGEVSSLLTYDLGARKVVKDRLLWYTSDSDSTRLFVAGDVCWVVNFNNTCARVAADGAVSLFETGVTFNYAAALSRDGKMLLAGGLHGGTFGSPDAPLDGPPENTRRAFRIDSLPGADEFVSGMAFGPTGTLWAVTTAYRLVRLSPEGKLEKVVPVY